jgi:hypothetical protein
VQRSEAPDPAPDSLAVVSVDPKAGAYTQHYFDSRGVVRLYAMTLNGGTWTLTRDFEREHEESRHLRQRADPLGRRQLSLIRIRSRDAFRNDHAPRIQDQLTHLFFVDGGKANEHPVIAQIATFRKHELVG